MLLKGKSQHGHSVIGQHGTEWKVIKEKGSVLFSDKKNWLLIESVKTNNPRWINITDDDNFIIVERKTQ